MTECLLTCCVVKFSFTKYLKFGEKLVYNLRLVDDKKKQEVFRVQCNHEKSRVFASV